MQQLQQKVKQLEKKLSTQVEQNTQMQKDYHNLLVIAAELVDALEQTVRGNPVTVEYLQDISTRLLESGTNSADLKRSATLNSARLHETPSVISTLEEEIPSRNGHIISDMYELHFPTVKDDLCREDRGTTVLVQALRWRLTKSTKDMRASVIERYVTNDLLCCYGSQKQRDTILLLLTSRNPDIKQSVMRLINAFSSLKAGRLYLSKSKKLLTTLAGSLKAEIKPSVTLEQIVAALQKLSLRRSVQTVLINLDVIDWLIAFLQNHFSLNDYVLEYAVALLMNLTLRSAGKEKCSRQPKVVLQLLTSLLQSPNKEITPYINGSLYSVLGVQKFRDCAVDLNLQATLEGVMKNCNHPDILKQTPFVIKQLNGELNDTNADHSDDETADEEDDEEEEDVLEPEIEANDSVQPAMEELIGEELLKDKYAESVVEIDRSASQKSIFNGYGSIEDDMPLPTTPDMHIQSEPIGRSVTQDSLKSSKGIVQRETFVVKKPNSPKVVDSPVPQKQRETTVSREKTPQKPPSRPISTTKRTVIRTPVKPPTPETTHNQPDPVEPLLNTRIPESITPEEYAAIFGVKPKIPRTPKTGEMRKKSEGV